MWIHDLNLQVAYCFYSNSKWMTWVCSIQVLKSCVQFYKYSNLRSHYMWKIDFQLHGFGVQMKLHFEMYLDVQNDYISLLKVKSFVLVILVFFEFLLFPSVLA
jgi:hypothetical protein